MAFIFDATARASLARPWFNEWTWSFFKLWTPYEPRSTPLQVSNPEWESPDSANPPIRLLQRHSRVKCTL